MNTTKSKFAVDQQVRCYDFPGLDRKAYYLEGTIIRISPEENPDCLEVLCSLDSMSTKEGSRVGELIYTPIETDLDEIWGHERIVILPEEGNTDKVL